MGRSTLIESTGMSNKLNRNTPSLVGTVTDPLGAIYIKKCSLVSVYYNTW
jgi:hypothetical protein